MDRRDLFKGAVGALAAGLARWITGIAPPMRLGPTTIDFVEFDTLGNSIEKAKPGDTIFVMPPARHVEFAKGTAVPEWPLRSPRPSRELGASPFVKLG